MITVTMSSKKYGSEDFKYDTMKEAEAGVKRLKKEAKKLKDGVKRKYKIREAA